MLIPLSDVISISMSSSMEAEFILAVAPPVIFKICFPFRNSFLLSRSPIALFGWPFLVQYLFLYQGLSKLSGTAITFAHAASAMFDLRKNISEFTENRLGGNKKIELAFLFFFRIFRFFRSGGLEKQFFNKLLPYDVLHV